MDRRVKERLIGATILVVLIVLIVPELLSGPKRPPPPRAALSLPVPTRSVSVDLATSKATTASAAADAASAASASDDAGAAAPSAASPATAGLSAASADAPDGGTAPGAAPANSAGEAGAPTVTTLRAQAPAPAPALESHASTPKSASEARRSSALADAEEAGASSSHRGWAVQLGSFANKENAEKLAHQLRTQRASVYVISSGSGPSLRYRVRVGPLRDREAAEHAIAKLKSEGHPATLVAP